MSETQMNGDFQLESPRSKMYLPSWKIVFFDQVDYHGRTQFFWKTTPGISQQITQITVSPMPPSEPHSQLGIRQEAV